MTKYYIIKNEQQEGPYTLDQLLAMPEFNAETLVWRQGMSDWQAAQCVEELQEALLRNQRSSFNPFSQGFEQTPPDYNTQHSQYAQQAAEPAEWFVMKNNMRHGPMTISQLIDFGITPVTPVWRRGMADWMQAASQSEIMARLMPGYSAQYQNNNASNQQYGNPQYAPGQQYSNFRNQRSDYQTNMLPMAIVATIVGALFSCIGMIFGIIAISKASNANAAYENGDYNNARLLNSSAKTNCIIAFIFAAIGIIGSISLFSIGGLHSII